MDKINIPPHVDWEYLKRFMICSESSNYIEAAKNVKTSPGALRKQMLRLEKQLGQALFLRQNKKILTNLTAYGNLLKRKLKTVNTLMYKEFLLDTSLLMENKIQKINIKTDSVLLSQILYLPFRQFINCNLFSIQYLINTEKLSSKINSNEVFIGSDPPFPKEAHFEELFSLKKGYYASSEYVEKHGAPKDIYEAKTHAFIYSQGNLDFTGKNAEIITLDPSIVSNNWEFSLNLCLSGHGILCLPHKIAEHYKLVRVLESQFVVEDKIFIGYIDDFHLSQASKDLIAFLKSYEF